VTSRRRNLLYDLKDRRGYSHLKEEALDCTTWGNHFGGGFGPVIRQNTEGMKRRHCFKCMKFCGAGRMLLKFPVFVHLQYTL
jgi:hypothetical protein